MLKVGNMLQLCSLVDRKWKVLIVDYDLTRLKMLEKMLHTCNFDVTKCRKAKEAISMLQEDQNRFDIVITDLYLPDMDGFEILKRIGSEMDLPIIMALDDDDNEDLIRKGLIYGACDYLVKPICIENIKHLWKHVFRKQRHEGLIKEMEQSGSSSSDLINNNNNNDVNNNNNESNTSNKFPQNGSATTASISDGEEHEKCVKKRKLTTNTNTNTSTNTFGDAQVKDDATTKRKKQRVIWTPELHAKFVAAVNQFGTSRAVPKKILEIMNIPGLTRENVASHLQKYRQYHKRLEQLQHPSKNDTKSSPMNHDSFQTQIIPSSSSSSLQLRDFTGLNSHPQTHDITHDHGTYYNEQYGHQHNIQMTLGEIKTSEANMNLRVVHHVENGNVIFPIASYTHHRSTIGSKVHVVETPWNDQMGLNNNYINGEINSIGAQPNGYEFVSQRVIDAYENYASFDLGYNDANALYMEQ